MFLPPPSAAPAGAIGVGEAPGGPRQTLHSLASGPTWTEIAPGWMIWPNGEALKP
jgi:hypothetical protein